jgi:hypothetical protein
MAFVEQDVHERAFDLERGAKRARIIAFGEDTTAARVHTIDSFGDTSRNPLNTAG